MIKLMLIVIILIGVIFLQIFLSKTESKWPGLILPIIPFVISFFFIFGMVAPEEGITGSFIFGLVLGWILNNIPTCILLGIYIACRGNKSRNKQLDKMAIQDLN